MQVCQNGVFDSAPPNMTASTPVLPALNLATLFAVAFKGTVPAAHDGASFESRYELAALDAANIARYAAHLGFAKDALPLTWYYLPVQRAHLATLLAQPVSFKLAGIIHTENEIVEHARPRLGRPLLLATQVRVEPPAANGAIYCTLRTDGAQDGTASFTCTSRYLVKRGQRGGPHGPREPVTLDGPALANWELTPSSGRAYAAVSCDWNPIHLSGWSARLMGLPAPIIHGMHSVGKACAELERATGRRVTRIAARFLAPIPLGTTATLRADETHGTWTIATATRCAVAGSFATARAPA